MKIVSIVLRSITNLKVEPQAFILQQADLLFSQYGIKSITMDDIAKHLGMSKKTIYQHFEDKNELVLKLMQSKLEDQTCVINDCCERADNAIHELFFGITHLIEMLSRTNPTMFYDLQKFYPEAWAYFNAFREQVILQKIRENLERGIKEGLYRSDVNIEIVSRMRAEQILISFNPHIFPSHLFSMSEVSREMTLHFIYGITTEKGYELTKSYVLEH